jgi:hypothetical protein
MKTKVLLGIWIVAAIIIGTLFLSDYSNQLTRGKVLSAKIETDSIQLNKFTQNAKTVNKDLETLNASISKTQSDIEVASNLVLEKTNTTDIIRALFSQAEINQVSLVPLSTQDWTTINTQNQEIKVFRITFLVNGTEFNVLNLIKWIQTSPFTSMVMENFTLTKANDPINPENSQSNMHIAIYAK